MGFVISENNLHTNTMFMCQKIPFISLNFHLFLPHFHRTLRSLWKKQYNGFELKNNFYWKRKITETISNKWWILNKKKLFKSQYSMKISSSILDNIFFMGLPRILFWEKKGKERLFLFSKNHNLAECTIISNL